MSPSAILFVRGLRVSFLTEDGPLQAVDGVSFDLMAGEVLAIVGESGSGKSVTAQTIMGLTRSNNSRIEGSVRLHGEELIEAREEDLRRVRGEQVAMIFQNPMTSFNPVFRVGDQIVEAIRAHRTQISRATRMRAPPNCSNLSASQMLSGGSMTIRTSSPVACASA